MNAATVTFLRRSGPLNLLVAEAEVLVRCAISDALRGEAYKVLEASSGPDAIMILRSVPVHLLFLDLEIPGTTNGLAVARLAQALKPRPKILLTGTMAAPGPAEASELGPFIPKPYAIARVVDAIAASLDPTGGAQA